MNLPSLQEFLKAEKLGRITGHRQGGLVGFKYTNETIFAEDWDEVTLNSRGIVFNEKTGEIVARPFKKFFNYQEFFTDDGNHSTLYEKVPPEWKPNISGSACYLEKIDGSLGICFWNPFTKKWQIKTGGSFESEQAIWGQKWYDEHLSNFCHNTSKTYLYEIVSNEDIHPIKYEYEGLVLLSIIDNETGEEMNQKIVELEAEELGIHYPAVYQFDDFNEAVCWAKKLPKTHEGLVITFKNGFKCKAKSDEWCRLAKLFDGVTKWNIWVSYDCEKDFFHANVDKHNGYKPVDDSVLFIPEELKEMRDYAESIKTKVNDITTQVLDMAKDTQNNASERKLQYEYVYTNYKENTAAVMKALDYLAGKCKLWHVKKIIHKTLQPLPGE